MPGASTDYRRENLKDEIVLGVLDVVEKNSKVTQRWVAGELGIALGLANAYLKRCVRKGLIRVSRFLRADIPTISRREASPRSHGLPPAIFPIHSSSFAGRARNAPSSSRRP